MSIARNPILNLKTERGTTIWEQEDEGDLQQN